jgi:16S rRNA (uracil1498-N3)-methyltransferase
VHRFFDPDLTEQSRTLPTAEQKHARVLRITPGETFAITNGAGLVVHASFSDSSLEAFTVAAATKTEAPYRIHLIQALAKGDRDEQAVQAATELGATDFTPWQAERSVSRWSTEKAARGRDRWQQIATEAMKQSDRSWWPTVHPLATTQQLEGPGLVLDASGEPLELAHLGATETTIVVGPEGGISPVELEQLEQRGFRRVRIGTGILRTSTAGPAAIAIIQALRNQL